jgi:hypothetical protein
MRFIAAVKRILMKPSAPLVHHIPHEFECAKPESQGDRIACRLGEDPGRQSSDAVD